MQEVLGHVAHRHDVVGDDRRRRRSATSGCRLRKRPWAAERPDLPRADRLEDHPDPEQVGRVADQHTGDRQHPPLGQDVHGEERGRDAEQEPEEEAEVDDEAQLLAAHLEEDPVGQPRVCSMRRITISFTLSRLST